MYEGEKMLSERINEFLSVIAHVQKFSGLSHVEQIFTKPCFFLRSHMRFGDLPDADYCPQRFYHVLVGFYDFIIFFLKGFLWFLWNELNFCRLFLNLLEYLSISSLSLSIFAESSEATIFFIFASSHSEDVFILCSIS